MKRFLLFPIFFLALSCEQTDLSAINGMVSPDSSTEVSSSAAAALSSAAVAISSGESLGNSSSGVLSSSSASLPGESSTSEISSASAPESSSATGESSSAKASSSSAVKSSSSKASSSSAAVQILGTCAPEKDTIVMTKSVKWIFTQETDFDSATVASVKFKWWLEGSYEVSASGKGKTSVSGQYPKTGSYEAKLLIGSGDTISCAPLQVVVAPITGCQCTAENEIVSIGDKAVWQISGCESDLGISQYTWSAFVGEVSPIWTRAEATLSSEMKLVIPKVEVSNDNGSYLLVDCPAVIALE